MLLRSHAEKICISFLFFCMATTSPTAPRPATRKDATPPATPAQKPIAVLRFGTVSAAIFANQVQTGSGPVTLRSVSLRRAYKDEQGALKFTHSLRSQDLLLASYALLKCFDLIEGEHTADDQ